MKNKIVTMTNEKFGVVRKITENGATIYCGADVAKALGYTNPRKALADHCRCVTKRYTPHPQSKDKQMEMSFVSEADVYRLICHSKMPSAIGFEKWVFEDVVPKAVSEELPVKSEQLTLETEEYHYFDKTYKGEPVITLADFEHITGVGVTTVRCRVEGLCKQDTDYLVLRDAELIAFKVENPSVRRNIKSIVLLKKTAVEKLFKWYKSKAELPECFIETKKKDIINAKEPKAPRKWKEPYADDFVITANTLMYMRSHAEKVYAHNNQPEYAKKHIDSINDLMTYCGFFMSSNIFGK